MLPELTNRENEVLEQIVYGFTNKEIACNLSISEATVENHIHNIYNKLGVSNRAQAVTQTFQLRIIPLEGMLENRGNPS